MTYHHEIDCIRGLAAIIIVIRHTLILTYADLGFFPSGWFECLTLFAVPVFFFLSGFSLTIRYKDSLNLKSFYKNRFKYLFPAYLIWTFLIYFFQFYSQLMFNISNENNAILPFNEFIILFFLNIIFGNVKTLWFLFVIFQYYLFYPYLLKLYKLLNSKMRNLILLSLFVITFIIYYMGNNLFVPFFLKYENYIFISKFKINIAYFFFFIPFLFYFIMGITLAFNWDNFYLSLKNNTFLSLSVFVAFFLSFISLPYIENVLDPRNKLIYNYFTIWILFNSIISILFLLMVFQYRTISLISINNLNTKSNTLNENLINPPLLKLNFEGKFSGHILKAFWVTGQYSLAIFLMHRVIMSIIGNFLMILHISEFIIKILNYERSGFFLLSILLFLLIIPSCFILSKLIWKLPFGKYIIGKKPKWYMI